MAEATRDSTVMIGDVARSAADRVKDPLANGAVRFIGVDDLDTDDLVLRRWSTSDEEELPPTFRFAFQPGDVLFPTRRPALRKCALSRIHGITGEKILVIRNAAPDRIESDYLRFLLASDPIRRWVIKHAIGGITPHFRWRDLARFEFALPTVDRQRSALRVLAPAAKYVDSLRDLQIKQDVLLRSLSMDIFRDSVGNAASDAGTLVDLFDHVVDRGHADLPILSVTGDGRIVRRESLGRSVDDATGTEKYLRVIPGDLAYNTMRLWQGAVGIAHEEGLVSAAYTVLRPKNGEADRLLLLELLRSPPMQRQYRRYVTGVASDRWRLYFEDLAKIRVKLPFGRGDSRIQDELQLLGTARRAVTEELSRATLVFWSLLAMEFGP